MTDSGEALAPVEAVETLSGIGITYLVGGVREAHSVAAGEVRRLAEALAVAARMHHGAMAEPAGARHGLHLIAAEAAAVILEDASVEEPEVALEAALWVAPEVYLEVCHREARLWA